jgi:hypothetical protein
MTQRIYHGEIEPEHLAKALIAHFDRGSYQTQSIGHGDQVVVQISTRNVRPSGGQTALSISLQKVGEGVLVKIGKQAWLGIAASLGTTALGAIRNPFSLLSRLDDIAQDIESLQLTEDVLQVIQQSANAMNASHQLSEKLRRMTCDYCNTANPVGSSRCLACGAPLGDVQPQTCRQCGYVVSPKDSVCPNCGNRL